MIILDRARIVGLEIKVQGDDSMKFFATAHHAHSEDLPFSRACGLCNGAPIKTSEFEVSETDWGVMEGDRWVLPANGLPPAGFQQQ